MCRMCNAPEHRDATDEQRKAICAGKVDLNKWVAERGGWAAVIDETIRHNPLAQKLMAGKPKPKPKPKPRPGC